MGLAERASLCQADAAQPKAAAPGPAGTRLSGKWDRHGATSASSLACRDLPCPTPGSYAPSLPSGALHKGPLPGPSAADAVGILTQALSPRAHASLRALRQVPVQRPGCLRPLWAPAAAGIARRSALPRACPCTSDGAPPPFTFTRSRGWARSNCCKERWGYLSAHVKEMFAALPIHTWLCVALREERLKRQALLPPGTTALHTSKS